MIMALKTAIINCDSSGGGRLDVFLAENLPGHTRSAVQKLIEAGRVTLCGPDGTGGGATVATYAAGASRVATYAAGAYPSIPGTVILKKNYLTSLG